MTFSDSFAQVRPRNADTKLVDTIAPSDLSSLRLHSEGRLEGLNKALRGHGRWHGDPRLDPHLESIRALMRPLDHDLVLYRAGYVTRRQLLTRRYREPGLTCATRDEGQTHRFLIDNVHAAHSSRLIPALFELHVRAGARCVDVARQLDRYDGPSRHEAEVLLDLDSLWRIHSHRRERLGRIVDPWRLDAAAPAERRIQLVSMELVCQSRDV
jgi:hypothetical protein